VRSLFILVILYSLGMIANALNDLGFGGWIIEQMDMIVQVLLSLLDGGKALVLGVREVPDGAFGVLPVVVYLGALSAYSYGIMLLLDTHAVSMASLCRIPHLFCGWLGRLLLGQGSGGLVLIRCSQRRVSIWSEDRPSLFIFFK